MAVNVISIIAALFLFPSTAMAVQHHGGLEGLVSHEIGHVLFVAGLVMFLAWIRGYHERGWPAFRLSLVFFLAWNLLTFSGHILDIVRDGTGLVTGGGEVVAFRAVSLADLFFYLTRLDHFLLVPAMAFLLAALRQWRSASGLVRGPEMTPSPLAAREGDER